MLNKSLGLEKKNLTPTPGIEPGPPGWKPGILAIRPRGIVEKTEKQNKESFCLETELVLSKNTYVFS